MFEWTTIDILDDIHAKKVRKSHQFSPIFRFLSFCIKTMLRMILELIGLNIL